MGYYQNNRSNDDISFDLMEHIGVLGKRDNGWTKEVNIVAWNGGKGKVDIREWDPDHERMTRGITLFEEEAEKLVKALARRYGVRYTGAEPAREAAKGRIPNENSAGELYEEPPVETACAAATA